MGSAVTPMGGCDFASSGLLVMAGGVTEVVGGIGGPPVGAVGGGCFGVGSGEAGFCEFGCADGGGTAGGIAGVCSALNRKYITMATVPNADMKISSYSLAYTSIR